MLAEALSDTHDRIEKFYRDGWASPWPVGVEMLCYMISHEAHHRGQACMLAHQLGYPLSNETNSLLWNWDKLLKENRSTSRPKCQTGAYPPSFSSNMVNVSKSELIFFVSKLQAFDGEWEYVDASPQHQQ